MKVVTRIIGGLAALWVLAAFGVGILGVWVNDGRWGMTATLLGFAAFVALLIFAILKVMEDA